MSTPEVRASWAVTVRHLAAAQCHLPVAGPEADLAWSPVRHYLHHNELGLALDEAIGLGAAAGAPGKYWNELLQAAENMQSPEQSQEIRTRLQRINQADAARANSRGQAAR